MGSSYVTSPLLLIINTLFDLYIMLVLLRFMLQWLRADFYNPVSQFIVRVTTPPLKPLRRFIPGFGGQDIAALTLALIIILIKYIIIRSMGAGVVELANVMAPIGSVGVLGLLVIAMAEILSMFINIFLFAVIISVILSWVNSGGYNPVVGLINSLSQPVMKPIRKFIPPMGGLDLSPLFASLGLMVLKMLLIPPIVFIAANL